MSDRELYGFAVGLIPRGKGRIWNYAMLDLGATLCSARQHNDSCPLMKLHGKVADFVYKKPQEKFAGSDRFYRGVLLKHLVRDRVRRAKTHDILDLPKDKALKVIQKLVEDKLISEDHGWLSISLA